MGDAGDMVGDFSMHATELGPSWAAGSAGSADEFVVGVVNHVEPFPEGFLDVGLLVVHDIFVKFGVGYCLFVSTSFSFSLRLRELKGTRYVFLWYRFQIFRYSIRSPEEPFPVIQNLGQCCIFEFGRR